MTPQEKDDHVEILIEKITEYLSDHSISNINYARINFHSIASMVALWEIVDEKQLKPVNFDNFPDYELPHSNIYEFPHSTKRNRTTNLVAAIAQIYQTISGRRASVTWQGKTPSGNFFSFVKICIDHLLPEKFSPANDTALGKLIDRTLKDRRKVDHLPKNRAGRKPGSK